jgi:hypothetical protein
MNQNNKTKQNTTHPQKDDTCVAMDLKENRNICVVTPEQGNCFYQRIISTSVTYLFRTKADIELSANWDKL